MVALLGGQVEFMFDSATSLPHIRAGKLKALAVIGPNRLVAMPEVPTMRDMGYPEMETARSWYGIFAPAGTPQEVVQRLNWELVATMRKPEVAEKVVAMGMESATSTPEDLAAAVVEALKKYAPVVKRAGINALWPAGRPAYFFFVGAVVIEMQGEKAHEFAFAGNDRAALPGDADREPALHRFQLFPLQAVVGIDLLPAEAGNLAQRLDRLAQFGRVQAKKLRLELRKIQVEADAPAQARLPLRFEALEARSSRSVAAGGVRFAHASPLRS